ncbi:putative acyltransferase [Calycina marina]|uniref:Acyltransferase n=1 Tax=Calycina marina TaxID=1763456 RepID=A0A9P7YWT1_9HELO|nr:putative acyltransferase [Calycina marina]
MFKHDVEHSSRGSQNQILWPQHEVLGAKTEKIPGARAMLVSVSKDVDLTTTTKVSPRVLRWCLNLLRPSLFTKQPAKKDLVPTAYLDGIRGLAAFLVYWQHHQGWARLGGPANEILENGYGFEDRYYFAAMPVFRLLFTGGHFAVPVFFVLSGYVLSLKPVSLIHAGNFLKLGDTLASALFRRWIRLHLPVVGTTFLYMTTFHLFGMWTAYPDHQATFMDELLTWYKDFWKFSFVFRPHKVPWPVYNVHLWSIAVEFKGSIVVYTALLAFSRFTRNTRLQVTAGLIFYFLYIVDGWYCAMFLSGMMICELDQLARVNNLPDIFVALVRHKTRIFYALFVASIYLGGVPSYGVGIEKLKTTPGWYYLSFLKPEAGKDTKWFYQFWAASCLVASTRHLPWLKRFFEMRFNQYLGRISFGLYLFHGPVLWLLGDRLYAAVGWQRDDRNEGLTGWVNIHPISKAGPLGLEPAFLLPQLILLPITLWMAEIAMKLFDEPSVKFAQWVYRQGVGQSTVKI